jgi:hypothetical protein
MLVRRHEKVAGTGLREEFGYGMGWVLEELKSICMVEFGRYLLSIVQLHTMELIGYT